MARQYIPDVYERLKVGDGVDANSIVGVIPQANLPPEAPPQPAQQYQLPDDLQHLEREVAFDEATIGSPVWRLGNDSPGITLANRHTGEPIVASSNATSRSKCCKSSGN